jgi:hypothetical protein
MSRVADVIAQYESGKYVGYELRVRAELIHDEGEDDSPDWRHDHTIELWAGDVAKFIEFLKTL